MRRASELTPLNEQAYQYIKRKIVSLELAPGSVIDEGSFREELGIGRTPIREALIRLSSERLVEIVPRQGTFVADVSLLDLQRIFEVRYLLEGFAARLAATRTSNEIVSRMEETLAAFYAGDANELDHETLVEIDEGFHRLIYEATNNPLLEDFLITLYAQSARLWYVMQLVYTEEMRGAPSHNLSILEAIRAGDGDLAEELMHEHIRDFQEKIGASIASCPSAATSRTSHAARVKLGVGQENSPCE